MIKTKRLKSYEDLKKWLRKQTITKIKKDMKTWSSTGKQYAYAEIRRRRAQWKRRDEKKDKKLKAKYPGKRISKSGKRYYEYRTNRSDKDRRRRL